MPQIPSGKGSILALKTTPKRPSAVVFDLGGVLVDWNPRYLMDRVIPDIARREHFLANVLNSAFLVALDVAPRARAAAAPIVARHPEYAAEITAYIERFEETIGGEFPEMAALVRRLDSEGIGLYGLTNWAGDTFDLMRPRLPTLALLRNIVVSGHEGIVKPDPRIFDLVCRRNALTPADAVFVDDNRSNAEGARAFGMRAIHHRSSAETAEELRAMGIPA